MRFLLSCWRLVCVVGSHRVNGAYASSKCTSIKAEDPCFYDNKDGKDGIKRLSDFNRQI